MDEQRYRITDRGSRALAEVERRIAAGDTRPEADILGDIIGEIAGVKVSTSHETEALRSELQR